MKGVISAIEYKNEVMDPTLASEDPKRLRPTIFIWTRGENGKRYRFAIKGFRPYFFCNNSFKIWSNDVEKMEWDVYPGIKKIYTYLPAQVRKLRKILEKNNIDEGGILEADVLYVLRFLIDSKIKGPVEWDTTTNTLKPLEEDIIVPLRKLFVDIELWSEKGSVSRRNDIIKCLSVYDSFSKKYNTWYVNDEEIHIGTSEWETHRCSKESELLKAFFDYFARKDPDVVSGYNVDFDLLCIKRRASKNGLSAYMDIMSALHSRVTKDKSVYGMGRVTHRKLRIRGVDWARNGLNIDGRNIIDILDLSRMVSPKQLESYTLDHVAKEFLGRQEGKITWQDKPIASHIKEVWGKEPETVLRYNMHDVELCVMLDDRLSLISLLDELRMTVGVRLEDAYSNQRMIDTEFLRRNIGKSPKKAWKGSKNQEKFPGGLVLDPIPGLHKFIALLDFKSLYPSVIRTLNIDQESWFATGKEDVYSWVDDLDGFVYHFSKEPRGLFPQILDDFSKKRDTIKEKAINEKDSFKKKVLSAREGALKILSNAMYGSFAFTSRKTSKVCASAVTSSGRIMLRFAIKTATDSGYTVVYGDTDSVFVELTADNLEEAKKQAEELVNTINSHIPEKLKEFNYEGEQLVSIKLELVYPKIFFMNVKKRYCGMKEDGKLDTKGLEIKRSDSSVFSKRLQENVIRAILNERTSEEIKIMVEKELNCFDLELYPMIGVPSALTKKFEEYKTNSIQKKAAYFSNTYLKTRFEFGSKPLRIYVMMVNQPEEVMEDIDVIALDENTIIPSWLKMDSKKMLKKTVKPKIEELLKTLGIEWASLDLKEELKEVKKIKIKKEKKEGKKGKKKKGEKGPLDSFLGGK